MHQKTSGLGFATRTIAALTLLIAAYVGAYFGTMTPTSVGTSFREPAHFVIVMDVEPQYRFQRLNPVFAPVHWADRRLRPHLWTSQRHLIDYKVDPSSL